MIKFIAGTIFGIIVSTIGFQGMAVVLDNGMKNLKQYSEKTVTEAKANSH